MGRLVAFGCSYTYGHGLPDVHPLPPVNQQRPGKPSNYGWVKLLADKLNLEVVNHSSGGAGNKEIFHSILNTSFEKNDLVVIAWTHFERYNFYYYHSGNKGARTKDWVNFKKLILEFKFKDRKLLTDLAITNYLTFQHADLYLKNNSVTAYHFNISDGSWPPAPTDVPIPENLQIRNFFKDVGWEGHFVDKALDDMHPGIESNKLLAETLYNKISECERCKNS